MFHAVAAATTRTCAQAGICELHQQPLMGTEATQWQLGQHLRRDAYKLPAQDLPPSLLLTLGSECGDLGARFEREVPPVVFLASEQS